VFNAFTASIRGRVQGVGFRYFVKRQAEALHLTGWVRNNTDGSVELQAKGQVSALEQLLQRLESGPIGSRIDKIDSQWLQESQDFKGFEIRG
jgi:acylphosphatase